MNARAKNATAPVTDSTEAIKEENGVITTEPSSRG